MSSDASEHHAAGAGPAGEQERRGGETAEDGTAVPALRQADGPLRRSTRAVLLFGMLAGLNTAVSLALAEPVQISIASDVYYHAAQAFLAGEDIYAATPPELPGYHYIYPPIVIVAFLPHAATGSELGAYLLQTTLSIFATAGLAWILLRAIERRIGGLSRLDRILVVGFTFCSAWSLPQFLMGQTTLWLALGIAFGLDVLDREHAGGRRETVGGRREVTGGVAIALASLVKLFPAVLGLWFLRRRYDRALLAAIATGLGGLILGAIALGPDLTVQYLTEVLVERFEGQTFEGTPDPSRNHTTVRRMLAAWLGGSSPLVTPLALALVGPPVAYCYRRITTRRRQLATLLATLVGTLLVMPLQPMYFSLLLYPALVLLVGLETGRPRRLLVAGIVCTSLLIGIEAVETNVAILPGAMGDPIVDAAEAVFTVVLPPTVGMWLLLAACVAIHTEGGDRSGAPA